MGAAVQPQLSVSALSSMNLRFEEDLELWSRLDVHTVGLFLPKLTAVGLDTAVARVVERELAVSSVAARGFTLSDPASWDADAATLATAVDVAADVDAGCLFITGGTPGPLGFEDCVVALDAALGLVRDRARDRGVRLAIEHTNPLRRDVGFVHTLRDMVEVARRLDVGVVVELTNCWFERGLDQVIADGVGTFQLVQVSDYLVGTLTASERAVPGDGDMPLASLLGAITTAGYDGYVELEMLGPRIEAEGYRRAIERALRVLEPMLPAAG
jgi:sugar phosphate isomerase/epimerase